MNEPITASILESFFMVLEDNFQTGMDRINYENFLLCKDDHLTVILRKIYNKTYKFTTLKTIELDTKRQVYLPTIRDRIVLDLLKHRLNRKFHVLYPDRNAIIKNIIDKLEEPVDYFIIRTDIKNFFDTIPQNRLLQKLKEGCLLTASEYYLIKEFLKLIDNGVPQGLSLSNVLSEIYLENIDFTLKRIHPRVGYYVRYVDDIIIIINGFLSTAEEAAIRKKITETFEKHALKANPNKENYIHFPSKITDSSKKVNFEFLGYNFSRTNQGLDKSISENKLLKYYKKIDYCFEEFKINHNFNLLYERLFILVSRNIMFKRKYYIDKNQEVNYKLSKVYFGILESYNFAEHKCWESIDKYLSKKLYSIRTLIATRKQRRKLFSLSLVKNLSSKKYHCIHLYSKDKFIVKILSIDPTISESMLQAEDINNVKKIYFGLLKIIK